MKTCTHCGAAKAEVEFPRRTQHGKTITGSWCKACHREYGREDTQRRTAKYAAGELAPEWKGKRRRCVRCGKNKLTTAFYASRGRPHGWCKKCWPEYSRAKREDPSYRARFNAKQNKRRKDAVALLGRLKSERGCKSCGERHPACLEFHHLDRKAKEFNLAQVAGRMGMQALMAEIEKCVILCSNCHRKLHYEERNG